MTRYLSPAWIEALAATAASATVEGVTLTVQQVVTGGPDGEVAYHVVIERGAVSVRPGRAPDADVTFTEDYPTAVAVAQGAMSAQAAFMAGRLRVGGDLAALMAHQAAFATLDDVFASVRADTTY